MYNVFHAKIFRQNLNNYVQSGGSNLFVEKTDEYETADVRIFKRSFMHMQRQNKCCDHRLFSSFYFYTLFVGKLRIPWESFLIYTKCVMWISTCMIDFSKRIFQFVCIVVTIVRNIKI